MVYTTIERGVKSADGEKPDVSPNDRCVSTGLLGFRDQLLEKLKRTCRRYSRIVVVAIAIIIVAIVVVRLTICVTV